MLELTTEQLEKVISSIDTVNSTLRTVLRTEQKAIVLQLEEFKNKLKKDKKISIKDLLRIEQSLSRFSSELKQEYSQFIDDINYIKSSKEE
ncbi:hypothetical protein [Aliarcobacter skirrowii]|mgnify:CR=1 FL=1|uniref:hypothetical protein n=1 Tax=Aliarcobacter skirrowii TaxID=28200 RepID=UPI0029AFA18C|nr:hypothetical protein [Aliarcobacter skirrowii]MDX4040292.1 hypothetical protein [Aliarcobacter skirrowii]